MSQETDPNVVEGPSASEESGNVGAPSIISEDSGLLDVLRGLSATVERLEDHIMTKTSASTTVQSAHGESLEQTVSQDHEYAPEAPQKVHPTQWHPMIDELSSGELARIEARLFLPPFGSSNEMNQLDTPLGNRTKSYLIERAKDAARTDAEADELIHRINDTKVLKTMWNPQLRIKEYLISDDEQKMIENASWWPFRLISSSATVYNSRGIGICDRFPELVSNADWNYSLRELKYFGDEPVWNIQRDRKRYNTHQRGNGRSNFNAPWISSKIGMDALTDSGYAVANPPIDWLPVPYPAIPPENLYSALNRQRICREPFTEGEYKKFDELIGKLWTIPPDGRLDLGFQHHVLKCVRRRIDIVEHVQGFKDSLQKLKDIGGLLQIIEFDDGGDQYTYQPFDCASASQVEEWILSIAPKLIKVGRGGYPVEEDRCASDYTAEPRLMNAWKRTVIRGLTDIYADRFWDSTLAVDFDDRTERDPNILFELHTTCSLKANERLKLGWLPSIFHITWMETAFEEEICGQHKSWIKQDCPSLKDSTQEKIGNVAASYFAYDHRVSGQPVKKYWTILALFPKSVAAYDPKGGTCVSNFWAAIIQLITESLETATHSWDSIAGFMEKLLPSGNTKQMLAQNGDFSVSESLFWIINKVDQILPMITDALEQWRWFSEAHELQKRRTGESPPVEEGGLPSPKDLEPILEQIRRLDACQRAFKALRERALSLRDGIFNLTGVQASLAGLKEAQESKVLAYNVKLLTYVTIFYLPLAFCTSMWAINDMFGTGTRGFAVITLLISSGTYAVVFGLLHPEYRRTVSGFLQRWTQLALEVSRKNFKPSATAEKAQQSLETKQINTGQEVSERQSTAADDRIEQVAGNPGQPSKGKRKESRTEEVASEASQQLLAKGRPSLINRFRGNLARGLNHKLSEMEEGGGVLSGS